MQPSMKIVAVALLPAITPLWAGLRGPGKYSGVVFFDRWDTCMLLSGPYLTYISESVKENLRPYSGKAIQIEASQVFQPNRAEDTQIRQYTITGPATAPQFIKLDGLDLHVKAAFEADRRPRFRIVIQNNGPSVVTVLTQQAGITVLRNRKLSSGPSDGRSDAVITRSSLFQTSATREWASDGQLFRASFAIEGEAVMPDYIKLLPGHFRSYAVALDISPGQYQFVFGYGGGVHQEASLLSNAISFDVSPEGLTSIVN